MTTINISNSSIKQIKLDGKQIDYRDSKLKGFMLRVQPSGYMSYACEYKRGRKITLGQVGSITPAQARDMAIKILSDAAHGIDPKAKRGHAKPKTLEDFINKDYHDWVLTNRKSGLKTISRIKRCFFPTLGNKPLTEINHFAIEQWRVKRLKNNVSKETVNRYIATFKAAISKAYEWKIIDHHPLKDFKLLKSDRNIMIRYLSKEEEIRLRTALDTREKNIRQQRDSGNEWREDREYNLLPDLKNLYFVDYLKPMVIISLNTGIRQGELFGLTWEMVNFDKKLLILSGNITKSGKSRHIPLNNEAYENLYNWYLQNQNISYELVSNNKYVFSSSTNNTKFTSVKKSWANLLNLANITEFRWHDMRHHFASKLVMAGVDLNTVRELLGHSEISMTLRYAHLAPEHKAEAVAKLNII